MAADKHDVFGRVFEGARNTIYAKTDEAKAVLKTMGNRAEDIRSQKKALEQLSSATAGCWQGLSGDALREKLASLVKEQELIAGDLEMNTQAMIRELEQLEEEDRELAAQISAGCSLEDKMLGRCSWKG